MGMGGMPGMPGGDMGMGMPGECHGNAWRYGHGNAWRNARCQMPGDMGMGMPGGNAWDMGMECLVVNGHG